MKKYEFTGETQVVKHVTLRRILRISDGLVGGWIEKEENLSHEELCFVYGDAEVSGNAQVSGDAQVFGYAQVYGNAQVYGDARVCENAQVYGDACVFGEAQVYGNARVSGNAQVSGNALVSGEARVYGDARVYGNAQVSGNAQVYGDAQVSKPHQTVNVTNLRWNFTSLPKGIQVGCMFLTLKEWREQHVKIGMGHGLTEEEAKAYYQLMRAVRRIQRIQEKKSK